MGLEPVVVVGPRGAAAVTEAAAMVVALVEALQAAAKTVLILGHSAQRAGLRTCTPHTDQSAHTAFGEKSAHTAAVASAYSSSAARVHSDYAGTV